MEAVELYLYSKRIQERENCGLRREERAEMSLESLSLWVRVAFSLFMMVFIVLHYTIVCLFSSPRRGSDAGRIKNPQWKVSVIVPAYNEEEVIEGLIHRLKESSYPIQEIIVVDDGSEDSTYEVARNMNATVLRTNERLGKPAALNAAVREAKGDIVVIFDADTLPDKDCVGHLVKHFELEDVGAVVGCTKVLNDGSLSKLVALEFNLCFYLIEPFSDKSNFLPIVHGANFAIRRELAHFREDALTEDFDLTINLTMKGYKIRFEPEAVNHVSAPSSFSLLVRQRERWLEGILETYMWNCGFWKKVFPRLGFLGLFLKALEYVIPLVWASGFSLFCISLLLNDLLLLLTALVSVITCTLTISYAQFRSKDKMTYLLCVPFLSYFYNLFVMWLFLKSLVLRVFRRKLVITGKE